MSRHLIYNSVATAFVRKDNFNATSARSCCRSYSRHIVVGSMLFSCRNGIWMYVACSAANGVPTTDDAFLRQRLRQERRHTGKS